MSNDLRDAAGDAEGRLSESTALPEREDLRTSPPPSIRALASPEKAGPPDTETLFKHRLAAFVTEILHGDEKHRQWLWDAANAFLAGEPVPRPEKAGPTPPASAREWSAANNPLTPPLTPPAASDLRERAERLIQDFACDPASEPRTLYDAVADEFAAIRAEAASAHELEVQELYIEAQRLGFERGKKWQRDYGAVSTPGHVLNETRLASMKPQREG